MGESPGVCIVGISLTRKRKVSELPHTPDSKPSWRLTPDGKRVWDWDREFEALRQQSVEETLIQNSHDREPDWYDVPPTRPEHLAYLARAQFFVMGIEVYRLQRIYEWCTKSDKDMLTKDTFPMRDPQVKARFGTVHKRDDFVRKANAAAELQKRDRRKLVDMSTISLAESQLIPLIAHFSAHIPSIKWTGATGTEEEPEFSDYEFSPDGGFRSKVFPGRDPETGNLGVCLSGPNGTEVEPRQATAFRLTLRDPLLDVLFFRDISIAKVAWVLFTGENFKLLLATYFNDTQTVAAALPRDVLGHILDYVFTPPFFPALYLDPSFLDKFC